MPGKELKNKPLVEAILELRWELAKSASPTAESDPYYRLLLGRFSERIESDYPFHEALPTSQIPDEMAAHMVQHRFRKAQNAWPLVQIGPGIMTVNETEGYTWDSFRSLCENAVSSLLAAHPAKASFHISTVHLRYVDAVEVDFTKESVFDFLRSKLKTEISLPDSLFMDLPVNKNPVAFNWQASFPHDEPKGVMTIRLAMGKHYDKPALIWETLVQTSPDQAPIAQGAFSEWLVRAHDLTDDWFFKLIEGDLERRFSSD